MPTRGVVNDEYILKVREIVRMAGRHGIYVLLDAHQDLLNRQFCGEGFPDWAVEVTDFPSPQKITLRRDEHGYPLVEDCLQQGFANYYLTADVGRNMESILKNENGVADMLGVFWRRVAELHKDESNVLGYDLLNEPSSGNYQRSKVDFVKPGWANNHLIMPFYKIVNSYIRQVEQDKLVFFEPFFTDIFGGGFNENVGGEEYRSKEVFSYHVYCGVEKYSTWLCKRLHSMMMPLKHKNISKLGTGSFMSEFGALPNVKYATQVLNDLFERADKHLQSWTYWQYKGFNDYTTASSMAEEGIFNEDGTYQEFKMKALVRPYAYKICATEVHESSFINGVYRLKFDSKQGCTTEIYIPSKYNFVRGFGYKCGSCELRPLHGNRFVVLGSGSIKLKVWER